MNSISDIKGCAARHLRTYVDPANTRAFNAYDRLGDAHGFEPTDALAPGLLDAPVSASIVIAMFSDDDSPFVQLRRGMETLIERTGLTEPAFSELDLDDSAGPWQLVRTVLRMSNNTSGLKASKVTKMLHRKRPHLVPIFDRKVAAFYGETSQTPWLLWPKLQRDLRENRDQLACLAAGITTPDGRPISLLRALDIVIWEHVITNCPLSE